MNCVRIVTGASGLIGAALTRHLAHLPGTLLAVDTHPNQIPVTMADITADTFTEHLTAHLSGADRAELYHAASHHPPLTRITDIPTADFARTVTDNLTATYTTLRAFALATGQDHIPGAAVLLSSVGATRAHRYLVAYDAAKAGIESLTRSFTLEFGDRLAIRAIAVGPITQSATTAADGDRRPELMSLVPRGQYADLDDIAAAVVAFASPCFDTATGHTLTLDGGLTIQLRPQAIERPPERVTDPRPSGTMADTGAHRNLNDHTGGSH